MSSESVPGFQSNPSNRGRLFAYCHDSVGIGHLTRTLSICERIGNEFPFATSLVATGTPYVPFFERLPGVDYIKLPALAKTVGADDPQSYCSKYLALSTDQLIKCRKALLRVTVEHYDPAVVLVDKAPLGVCGELVPALKWLRRNRPRTRIIFGMRDIEDSPEATIRQWARAGVPDLLEAYFDEIWVYGMRDVFDVTSEYRLPVGVEKKLRFMGYVAQDPCTHEPSNGAVSNSVLVTVGGGTDGEFLLRTYLDEAAPRLAGMGVGSTIVGGPDLPATTALQLKSRAQSIEGVEWIDFDPCMNCRIRSAQLVVSMGGYNTLCQIARNRKPALVVPRTKPRLEQTMRARLWSDRAAVEVAEADGLTPVMLADRICDMLGTDNKPTQPDLDLHGLRRVCARFAGLWQTEAHHAAPLYL